MTTKTYNFILAIICLYQSSRAQSRDNLSYDFSCLNETPVDVLINTGGEFEDAFISTFGSDVTMAEEISIGELVMQEFKKENTFVTTGSDFERINSIKNKLVKHIRNPRGFNYSVYLIDDDKTINAFTAGGKIFITQAIVDFCKNSDELACIIGHEIAHNELGHIRKKLSQIKASEEFWGKDFGSIAADLYQGTTTAFNQKHEAHSDMLGMDIARAAGYDICANIDLWKRMAQKESGGEYSFEKLFRSHPYSQTRSQCSAKHIESNYGGLCK